jgi:hypothetical protein
MKYFSIAATFVGFVLSVAGDNVIQVYKKSNRLGMQEELDFIPRECSMYFSLILSLH